MVRPLSSNVDGQVSPLWQPTSLHVGRPVRPKRSATSHLHPRLGGRPRSATPLAVHTSRDMDAQFRPPFGFPLGVHIGSPRPIGGRPRFGSPLWSPTQRTTQASSPITIPPDASGHKNRMYRGTACARPPTSAGRYGCALCALMDARICARDVGPRICGDKQKPPPLKG